jgi:hypothetical protein
MKSYWQCDLTGGVTMSVAKGRLPWFDAPASCGSLFDA